MKLSTHKSVTLVLLAAGLTACAPSAIDPENTETGNASSGQYELLEDNYEHGSFSDASIEVTSGETPGAGTLEDPYDFRVGGTHLYKWKATVSDTSFLTAWGYTPENPDVTYFLFSMSCGPSINSNDCGIPMEIDCALEFYGHEALTDSCRHPLNQINQTDWGKIAATATPGTNDINSNMDLDMLFGIKYTLCGVDETLGCSIVDVGYIRLSNRSDN